MSQQQPQPTGSVGQQMYSSSVGEQAGVRGQSNVGAVGQVGASHQKTHAQVGQQFESEMTPELTEALEVFDRTTEIAAWCADKCIEMGPEMAECARLCEDISELASLNEKLIARDSINGPDVAEAFLKVAQQGLPILNQYQNVPHVRETLEVVNLSIDATNKLLSSISSQQLQGQHMGIQEQVKQQGQMPQQPQGQQFPSQQFSGQQFPQTQQPQTQQYQQPQTQQYQQPQQQHRRQTEQYSQY